MLLPLLVRFPALAPTSISSATQITLGMCSMPNGCETRARTGRIVGLSAWLSIGEVQSLHPLDETIAAGDGPGEGCSIGKVDGNWKRV
jgi:hypothetical protein